MAKRKLKFKTETQKLLDLVIHSLYSHNEVFLRELVSNASDAIDRLRFLSLTDKKLAQEKDDYRIKLIPDQERHTLTISDNGIGMDDQELVENIGTIARSGTGMFLEALQNSKKQLPELIGQFGVGFYSAFMVADKVTVVTRKAGQEKAWLWESRGVDSFSLEETEKEGRGTDITLHLKEDAHEYAEEYRLRTVIKQYSDFIEYPIVMDVERREPGKDGEEDTTKIEEETLNSMKAIWMRSPAEVKDEEYEEFYKHLSHDYDKPLAQIHFRAEGVTEFTALLYIPAHMPFNLMLPDEKLKGVQLYVRRVFILDDADAMMPRYLRFVKGVVDSSDLPLNVSREILQQDRLLAKIKSNLVKKVLDTLSERMEKDREQYTAFFRELGAVLKEGLALDYENREKIQSLLLFENSNTKAGELASLDEYLNAMAADQECIYYITGESREELEHSPYLETLRAKKYPVLFMTEAIDELVMQHMTEYKEKKFRSVTRGSLEPEQDEDKQDEKQEGEQAQTYQGLMEYIQKRLDEHVKEVKISSRLVESPACLVTDEFALSANMERLLKAMRQDVPPTKRILEINPTHPLIKTMQTLYEKDRSKLEDLVDGIYDQALIAEGRKLQHPERFTHLITELLTEKAASLTEK